MEKILYRGEYDTRTRRINALKSLVGPLLAFLAFSAISLAFFSVATGTTENYASRDGLVLGALAGAANLLCLLVFGASVDTAIKTIFYSKDLTLLERLPISDRLMLSSKMTETIAYAGYSFIIVVAGLLMGYGLSGVGGGGFPGQILYYPTLLVVVAALLLIGIAVAVVAALLVCRFVPRRNVSPALFILASGFALFFSWLYGRFYGSPSTEGEVAQNIGSSMTVPVISRFDSLDGIASGIAQYFGALGSLAQPILSSPAWHVPPGSWAAQALSGAGSAQPLQLVAGLAPLLAVAAVAALACTELASRTYTVARSKARSESGLVKTLMVFKMAEKVGPRLLPASARPSFMKECCFIIRDVRSMMNLVAVASVTVALLVVVLYYAPQITSGLEGGIVGVPPDSRLEDAFTVLILVFPYVVAAAAGPAAAARAGRSSVGYEGRAWRIYISSPTSMKSVLWGKCAAHTLVGFFIACLITVVVVVLVRSFVVPGLIVGLVGGLVLSAASSMVHIGVGAGFARFDWSNPAHATRGLPHFICLILIDAFVVSLGVIAGLLVLVGGLFLTFVPVWVIAYAAAAVYITLYLVVGMIVLRIGASRLYKVSW